MEDDQGGEGGLGEPQGGGTARASGEGQQQCRSWLVLSERVYKDKLGNRGEKGVSWGRGNKWKLISKGIVGALEG